MSTRARYQFGCLTRRKRFRGGDVWQFRFSETTMEDRRCRRSRVIGTLAQYPTRADILRVVERFPLRINLKHRFAVPVTLDAVVDHYVEQELPILRYGTQQSHLCTLNRWILLPARMSRESRSKTCWYFGPDSFKSLRLFCISSHRLEGLGGWFGSTCWSEPEEIFSISEFRSMHRSFVP